MEEGQSIPPLFPNLTPGLPSVTPGFLDLSWLNSWCRSAKPHRDCWALPLGSKDVTAPESVEHGWLAPISSWITNYACLF